MPQLERYTERPRFRIQKLDSMGRNAETARAMTKNDPKPHMLGEEDQVLADNFAVDYAVWPKVMYRAAFDDNGVPNGDLVSPSYPLPYDLAVSLGIAEKGFLRINQTNESQGHFLVRHPYVTTFVPHEWDWTKAQMVDEAECKRQEEALIAAGWVYHPSEIPGVAKPVVTRESDPFKPLPPPKPKEKPEPTSLMASQALAEVLKKVGDHIITSPAPSKKRGRPKAGV